MGEQNRILALKDLPPPIGLLTTAHDLCGYPSGLDGLGACAPAQSRYLIHDGMDFRLRGGNWPPKTCPRPFSDPRPAGMDLRLRGGIQRLFTFFSV